MTAIKKIYLGVGHGVVMQRPELERPTEFPNLYETNEYRRLICNTFFVDIYIRKGSKEDSEFKLWLNEEKRESYDLDNEAMRIALPHLTAEDIVKMLNREHRLGRIGRL